ncbi:MAG: CARDB domain-containing protein [Acidimicrobiales bacterium]
MRQLRKRDRSLVFTCLVAVTVGVLMPGVGGAQAAVAPTRDLTITSFTVSPTNPVRGRTATAAIVVKNQGNSPAGPFPVQWNAWWLAAPLSSQVNSLAPGASTTVNLSYVFPADGTVDSWATVDAANTVAETNEANNLATAQLVVQLPLPDLVVNSVAISPATPVAGQPTTATIVVKNQGNTAAGPFPVQWTPWFLAAPLTAQVIGLAPGATTTVNLSYAYPFAAAFDSTVLVDPANAVPELVENNNAKTVQVLVGTNAVDLVVTSLTASPNPATQGGLTTFTATVQNQGNAASGPSTLQWNPDSTGLITPSAGTSSAAVGALSPGQSTNVGFTFAYPKAGTFRITATADATNAVGESNENNNRRILDLVVNPANVDLVIDSFTINPDPPIRASKATATIVVRNAGTFPAGSFQVQWKVMSTDNGGPTAIVNGLQPGQTRTVTIEFAFPTAGTFTSVATVDVFNQVFEPGGGENNNVATRSVNVLPRVYELRVTLDSMHIFDGEEDGLDGNGEWDPILFAALEPGASCDLFGTTIADVTCLTTSDDSVDDGDNLTINRSLDVTLVEFFPLVAAVGAIEFDDVFGVPTGANFLGLAPLISFLPDYLTLGTVTVDGVGSEVCSGGRCFSATFTVTVLSQPPPFFTPPGMTTVTALSASQRATLDKIESTLQENARPGPDDRRTT